MGYELIGAASEVVAAHPLTVLIGFSGSCVAAFAVAFVACWRAAGDRSILSKTVAENGRLVIAHQNEVRWREAAARVGLEYPQNGAMLVEAIARPEILAERSAEVAAEAQPLPSARTVSDMQHHISSRLDCFSRARVHTSPARVGG